MTSCLLTIRGRGKSPALSCPRLPPPRSILRIGQGNTGPLRRSRSGLLGAAAPDRGQQGAGWGTSLWCTVPLGHPGFSPHPQGS